MPSSFDLEGPAPLMSELVFFSGTMDCGKSTLPPMFDRNRIWGEGGLGNVGPGRVRRSPFGARAHAPRRCPVSHRLSALADPVRIQLFRDLAGHPDWALSCSTFDVPVGRAVKSHHYWALCDADLVEQRCQGPNGSTGCAARSSTPAFPGSSPCASAPTTPSRRALASPGCAGGRTGTRP